LNVEGSLKFVKVADAQKQDGDRLKLASFTGGIHRGSYFYLGINFNLLFLILKITHPKKQS
jgi:hypothetical protein